MKIASLNEIKKGLKSLPEEETLAIMLRLIKYKKENKELIHYLLFEAQDENSYIEAVKEEMYEGFEEMNMTNLYWAKKTVRKVLRITNKHIKYSGDKQTEIQLLMYFCQLVKESGLRLDRSVALSNLFDRQLLKIEKALGTIHEDLQYDYRLELEDILN